MLHKMSDVVISVENLSKRYLIGHQADERVRSTSLREVIGRGTRNFARKAMDLFHGRQIIQGDQIEEFWALRDVSFEIMLGEVVGIIGRNGAGKSTLLKILSRIVEPSTGQVRLRGRVSSLLEVGTGFHSELSGRENIFLNAAILGMCQREIRKKFDEIVAFADVAKFVDTPVKRYSSGMYVRLAFAVAAHLNPDIFVIDEVLAVGDAEFQKKCLERVDEMSSQQGRTVLFVSHNMEAILKFCSKGILFDSGQIVASGAVKKVLSTYLDRRAMEASVVDLSTKSRPQEFPWRARLSQVNVSNGQKSWSIPFGQRISFDLWIDSKFALGNIELGIGLFSARGFEIASWTSTCSGTDLALRSGSNVFRVEYGDIILLPGQYYIGLGLRSMRGFEDYIPDAVSFEVTVSEKSAEINAQTFGGLIVPRVAISTIQ
jgi:lipopolysaccharide transport system ATP-binding protein